jgi:hypothetical protein
MMLFLPVCWNTSWILPPMTLVSRILLLFADHRSLAKPGYDKCTKNKELFDIINEDIALDEQVQ